MGFKLGSARRGTSSRLNAQANVLPIFIITTSVPGAPTIGTATATSSTTATVTFTAPANNGGSVITSYTATSSPGSITGTLSQAGSGTITVTGLTAGTSYTFTVTATNAIGTSPASAASNSITTPEAAPTVIGQSYGGGYYGGQIGASSTATHYLVVGPRASAQSGSLLKYKNGNNTNPAGDASSVTDGPQNTANIVADANSTVYPAAHFCNDLSTGGYSDWYLPAKNELEVLYYNLKPDTTNNDTSYGINANAIPARASNYTTGTPARTSLTDWQLPSGAECFQYGSGSYWSSSTAGSSGGWSLRFWQGTMYQGYKTNTGYVRAIRKVAV